VIYRRRALFTLPISSCLQPATCVTCDVAAASKFSPGAFAAPNKQQTSQSSLITIYPISPTTYHRIIDNMAGQGMVDPAIFEDLQARVDEDTAVRDVRAPIELRTTSH
jgi:hypothetical protein